MGPAPPPPVPLPLAHSPYMPVAAASVPAKCLRCGTPFWAVHAGGRSELGWAFCPRCGQPTPSLPPRTEPPLFTWEIYRRFYPEPTWPRSPTPRVRTVLVVFCLIAGLALLGVGGTFGYFGAVGLSPHQRTVAGQVLEQNGSTTSPASGALITLSNASNGAIVTVATDTQGDFSFSGVPAGEHQVRVQLPGFRLSQMEIFLAPLFAAPSNTSSLSLFLLPGNLTQVYDQALAPYPDVETYVSFLFSASTIEVLGGCLALWGAFAIREGRSPARGVVGASAGLLAPFLAAVSGFDVLFLQVAPLTVVLAGITAILAGAALVLLLSTQRPLDGVPIAPTPPPG